jgi:outer membrane protein assembly factor BamD
MEFRMTDLRPAQALSFFPTARAAARASVVVATLAVSSLALAAQTQAPAATPVPDTPVQPTVGLSNTPAAKTRKQDRVVQTKDTVKENKKLKNDNPLEGMSANHPDKALYDKAIDATKHGRFDVARLDLQTLLNTYPDSEFQMRAKLAIADSWYKEGGTAALTQAEQEYKDFITFFPNAPEAAEAQMRVGDIYFRQMDRPDRDSSRTLHAEEEYRLMLQQFPESTLAPQATQRLREVQEVMATREADIASFYASHMNWPATIARYQTVVDTYPLYSHMDDTLIGLGDAYAAEAKYVRNIRLPEDAKARLEKTYDDQAVAAYRKVILEHSAAPHVEDARDRLSAMNRPIPVPTPEQAAASLALENSRAQYTLARSARVFLLREPDTVKAATIGDPPLEDAKATLAPTVIKEISADFNAAINPNSKPAGTPAGLSPQPSAAAANAVAPVAAAAPLQFQDVPAAGTGAPIDSAVGARTAPTPSGSGGLGIEIVQPAATPAATQPAADPYAIKAVGPTNTTPMAPIEKPDAAPDTVNDIKPGSPQPATAPANGKGKAPPLDKQDESSSKQKKKKGLDKLNPF